MSRGGMSEGVCVELWLYKLKAIGHFGNSIL